MEISKIPTTARNVQGWCEKKSPWYERYEKSKDGTKNPWYETSTVRKVHKRYETSMVRIVYGTKSPAILGSTDQDVRYHDVHVVMTMRMSF